MKADRIMQVKLLNWSNGHALAILVTSVLMLFFTLPIMILLLVAVISFNILLYRSRSFWTSDRPFGWANKVTLLRLLLVYIIALIGSEKPLALIEISVLVFCMDGVDGWLARKLGTVSEFGEYFDKETDAFFILLLCWLLYLDQRLGLWILIPGLMRYLFVCFLLFAKPPAYKEPQTMIGKYIFAITVIILIFSFTSYEQIYQPLAILMTLLIIFSFADTLRLIYYSDHHEHSA